MLTDREMADRNLKHGEDFPYDGEGAAKDWAHAAARGVLADLLDRRGIKWEFEKVDADVRVDIVMAIAAIIRAAAAIGAQVSPPALNDDMGGSNG